MGMYKRCMDCCGNNRNKMGMYENAWNCMDMCGKLWKTKWNDAKRGARSTEALPRKVIDEVYSSTTKTSLYKVCGLKQSSTHGVNSRPPQTNSASAMAASQPLPLAFSSKQTGLRVHSNMQSASWVLLEWTYQLETVGGLNKAVNASKSNSQLEQSSQRVEGRTTEGRTWEPRKTV